ncbi:MAG: T9SS type A sorting domain-containing protein [Candidatus Latescibacterota bacterium]|nr:MAG: T9SS type A sorting domain-containing protein [Candidatus Latescibacterota bacterium]
MIEGSELSTLAGVAPERIVAFRYLSGWVQIPVQVDERAVNDFGVVYNSTPVGIATLAYTDAGTFMGADPDTGFDDDDELVFMAKDTGDPAAWPTPDPTGVVPGSRVEVVVTDPLTFETGYAYLFESDGSLVPGAGIDYVTYNFVLLSGPYLTTYNTTSGPNPENSVAITSAYRTHFSDRWIRDEVNVYAGGATGDEILDRHKNLFSPGNCARSEDTFSGGEGAFFANIDGPVRAIRSYMGANSGPMTQRDHFFYKNRHDIKTYLRVHAISGVMDFYDYSPAAAGMTYYNDLNTDGVLIDGEPTETVIPGQIVWEMVTGAQGTLVHTTSVTTDIPGFDYTSYYLDDATPPVTQCTGDEQAYGASGMWVNQAIPNTDPYLGEHNIFIGNRIVYVEPPNQPPFLAELRYDQTSNPLVATISPVTAVREPEQTPGYRLSQNHPNPFRTETQFSFATPTRERARIRIFDVKGRVVKTLFDPRSGDSGALVTWDGKNDNGRRVASGIYFYQLKISRSTLTRKMVLLD